MKHRDTTVSPTCANVAFRGMSSTTTASHAIETHLTFRTPGASGYAQTHTRRFTPTELPHCSIAARLCVEQRHSTGIRLPVDKCGFEHIVYTVISSSYYRTT